ncbi:MAG TPA: galactokinase [Terriglobales bacterium]|nr:galactokinase [Terriglobales bacterium]
MSPQPPPALLDAWRAFSASPPLLYRAPGRVNLIGEHTDYNQGLVLPCAISLATWIAAAPRDDDTLRVASLQMEGIVTARLTGLAPQRSWGDGVLGVAAMLARDGERLRGANLLIASEIPLGAGLSSSAALEVGAGFALLALTDRAPGPADRAGRWRLAHAAQAAEHQFVGTRCGIMDPACCVLAQADHALWLDCRSLDTQLVPLPAGIRLALCDTGVRHALASSEYNRRRQECEAAVAALRAVRPALTSLRELTPSEFAEAAERVPEPARRRARHVISENQRVEQAVAALAAEDWPRLRAILAASHRSLREDFEVSSPELDAMVAAAESAPGFLAGRMTGGGFGGATVNFIREGSEEAFAGGVSAAYRRASGREAAIRIVTAADAVGPA